MTRAEAGIRILAVLVCGLLLVGCGSEPRPSPATEQPPPDDSETQKADASFDTDVNRIIRPLKLVEEEYRDAVRDGSIVHEGEYQESLMFAEEARRIWKESKSRMQDKLPERQWTALDQQFDTLLRHVQEKKSVMEEEALVASIRQKLGSLREQEVPPELRDLVDSVRRADRDIQAETIDQKVRLGASLVEPANLYRGQDLVSPANDASRQLRVWVREKRTKRALPGSTVRAVALDATGNTLERWELLETRGPYLLYARNVRWPSDATRLRIRAGAPRVGRHADMKSVYTDPVKATYDIDGTGSTPVLQGENPSPLDSDYELGTDLEMALGEPLAIKTVGPYRVGFIAEHSEPYWVWHQSGSGSPELRLASIPEDANRHLEIVLLDRQTNRWIPHADIQITGHRTSGGSEPVFQTRLPFLLSAFYHYGDSLQVAEGSYRVKAQITPPELVSMTPRDRSGPFEVEFQWEAESTK